MQQCPKVTDEALDAGEIVDPVRVSKTGEVKAAATGEMGNDSGLILDGPNKAERKAMLISVASGKGGTGKTTVAVNLALAAHYQSENEGKGRQVQIVDCDVEEPNCHIFLKPTVEKSAYVTVPVPEIDADKCSLCGLCGDVCAFHAIMAGKKRVVVFPEMCHGCGACAYLCPENAITEVARTIGKVEIGSSGGADRSGRALDFVHGILNTGEALAPPIIARVKKECLTGAGSFVMIDTPPGTSCNMVESVRDTHFCVLVTEPTPFGLHDLRLAADTLKKLGVKAGVVINRCDIGDDRVLSFCKEREIPVLAEIPHDRKIAELYAKGEPLVDRYFSNYNQVFQNLLRDLLNEIPHHAAQEN